MNRTALAALLFVTAAIAIQPQEAAAGDKYPLTMTAVYTEGHNLPDKLPKHDYQSGNYECTRGDETHAPDCRTIVEWAELDRLNGTPSTVLFTMADGVQIGVQESSVNKVYETTCGPGTPVVFCDLYFQLLSATQATPAFRQGQFGQAVPVSGEEYQAAQDALHRKLFGNGNEMRATFRYRLKGKPDKNGFQRIEVEGVDGNMLHMLNPLGEGYYVSK